MRKIKGHIFTLFLLLIATNTFGATFFSGFTGGKINYSSNIESEKYDPDLKLQAFFQGQFNFSENSWSHIELSIDTSDLLNEKLFHSTPADFSIDEISFIQKAKIDSTTNYFSVFMGTYDPIGSDIFLRRYFAAQSIASKITESWLGLAGSILYPHFGLGVSDVVRFYKQPMAAGCYFYINHEDDKYFVFNADLRYACMYRLFTMDFAGGIGAPLADKNNGEDVILTVNKLYWHAGTTMLIGNAFTQSLFIQAGINNAPFTKSSGTFYISQEEIYLLFEPRFRISDVHCNISLFSLPQNTVNQLLFVSDSLGVNLNIYTDSISWGSKRFTVGSQFSYSLANKYFMDLKDIKNWDKNAFSINLAPYCSTNVMSGELHILGTVKFMNFINHKWYDAFSTDIGFRTSF
ncbi:MAG: hypothetical protein MJ188_07205 [Treponema sp.]|nr:hypothetical protein [Treponema sp.]